MPRHTGHFPGDIAHLKQNVTDIIYDFVHIYNFLADYYNDFLISEHIHEFKDKAKKFSNLKPSKPAYKNRIYITTNYTFVPFMAVDFDEPVLENLKFSCELIQPDEYNDFYDGKYYSILWIFEGSKLTYTAFLSPKTAMQLVSVFHKENLVNVGAFRDEWVGAPRRRAKGNPDK